MPEKFKYWKPIFNSFYLHISVVLLCFLFKPPVINAGGIHFIDWTEPTLVEFVLIVMSGYFVLLQLIPGLLLANNYLKNDKKAVALLSDFEKEEFINSIDEVVRVSCYVGGNYAWWNSPVGVLADYWYYRFHLKDQTIMVSSVLFENLDFFKEEEFESRHVFSFLPLTSKENWFDLKGKKPTPKKPSDKLIRRFEKKYRSYSTVQLKKYVESEGFRKEAKIAANNILKERIR